MPLSKPNVSNPHRNPPQSEAEGNWILVNPIYVGLGPFPPIVPREVWIEAARNYVAENGLEQFLVDMLQSLDDTLTDALGSPQPRRRKGRP